MNMKEMTMEDIRKRITYRQEGDFLVPNIGLPEEEENQPELRKYGMMRKNYLKENNLQVYESLVANGTLFQEMVKVDEAADRIKEQVLPQLLKDAGVTEELKQKDQLKWVGLMESCHHQVEEIILTELVYS